MKSIIITTRRIGIEIACILLAFLVAEGLNLYAIKKHQTSLSELWTQLHIVLILMLIIYAVFTAVRILLYCGIKLLPRIYRHYKSQKGLS
jgi:hypothetical protein